MCGLPLANLRFIISPSSPFCACSRACVDCRCGHSSSFFSLTPFCIFNKGIEVLDDGFNVAAHCFGHAFRGPTPQLINDLPAPCNVARKSSIVVQQLNSFNQKFIAFGRLSTSNGSGELGRAAWARAGLLPGGRPDPGSGGAGNGLLVNPCTAFEYAVSNAFLAMSRFLLFLSDRFCW